MAQDIVKSEVLRIATYNIRREGKEKAEERLWQNRKEKLAKLIASVNPDVICMQEATKEQIEDLKKLLPHYDAVGRSRGSSWGGLGTDEANPIFYNTDTLYYSGTGTFSINSGKKSWFWNPFSCKETGWLPRICTWVRLHHKKTGKQFYVYNTHLDNDYDLARQLGAEVIRKEMDEKSPIIFTGDFNMEFKDYLKTIFDNFEHARDKAQHVAGPQATRTGWNDEELKEIDHILVQKDTADVIGYTVVQEEKPYTSDHRLVFADILLR